MNTAAAELIANNLASLVHPGDDRTGPTPIPLPMFRASAIPPEMRERFAADANLPKMDVAKLVSEAIVNLIEDNGWTITSAVDYQRLEANQLPPAPPRHITLRCNACSAELFTMTITDPTNVTTSGPALIEAIGCECPRGAAA